MKTVLIISELAGGGVERVNVLLAKGLKQKYKVCFLAVKGIGEEYIKDFNYIVLHAESGKKAVFKMLKAMKEMRPDYIITCNHTDTVCSLLYSKLIDRKAKSIFVVHSVYSSMFVYKKKRQLILQHYIPKLFGIYHKCDAVVYVSKGVGEDFRRLYHVMERAEYIIYNPVFEKMPLIPENIRSTKALGRPLRLVSVGRLDVEKRQRLLIEAVAELSRAGYEAELYIYGQGALEKKLKEYAQEQGVAEKFHLKGFSTAILEELPQYDIFVLSSEFESFGNVIVEAMGAGLPVVAMDCPVGPREILQNGELGVLTENGDVKQMVRTIEQIAEKYPSEVVKKAFAASKKYELEYATKEYMQMLEGL